LHTLLREEQLREVKKENKEDEKMLMGVKNSELIEKVLIDLKSNNAEAFIIAHVGGKRVDYTIEAEFPDGKKWEIVNIKETATQIVAKGREI